MHFQWWHQHQHLGKRRLGDKKKGPKIRVKRENLPFLCWSRQIWSNFNYRGTGQLQPHFPIFSKKVEIFAPFKLVVVVLRSPIHANEPSEYNGMLYCTSNRELNNGIKVIILICIDGTSQYHNHLKSVYLCSNCKLNLSCNLNSVTKIHDFIACVKNWNMLQFAVKKGQIACLVIRIVESKLAK